MQLPYSITSKTYSTPQCLHDRRSPLLEPPATGRNPEAGKVVKEYGPMILASGGALEMEPPKNHDMSRPSTATATLVLTAVVLLLLLLLLLLLSLSLMLMLMLMLMMMMMMLLLLLSMMMMMMLLMMMMMFLFRLFWDL